MPKFVRFLDYKISCQNQNLSLECLIFLAINGLFCQIISPQKTTAKKGVYASFFENFAVVLFERSI